jgi:hypothetical protein
MNTSTDGKFYSNYLGIVVANNDPQKKGRVKIYIPSISPTVYNNWNQTITDKKFKFLGKNINSDLTEIVEDLKDILPWAECAAPITGEVASGRYNSFNRSGTISDSNDYPSSTPVEKFKPTEFSQNPDGTGEKPANIFEKHKFALKDAFVSPPTSGTNKANLYGQNYRPSSYSNKAKGSFSIPPVGSHLWVFFVDGNPMYPVYFAASHGATDWQGLYEFNDYPDSYENKTPNTESPDHNVQIYRNKYILNQKGGTIEIVNTDNRESLNLTHYSGSFISFTNPATIHLSTANEQHLILGDKFETIRGTDNRYSDGDSDNTVRGDVYRKVGSLDAGATQRWKDVAQVIADIKQRFELQRVSEKTLFNSLEQTVAGTPKACPVCKQNRKYNTLRNVSFGAAGIPSVLAGGGGYTARDGVALYDTVSPIGIFSPGNAQSLAFPATTECPSCGGTGYSRSSMDGTFEADPAKQQLQALINSKIIEFSKHEASLGLGGHEVVDVTKHKIETIGTVMNDFGSIRIDSFGKMFNSTLYIGSYGVFQNQQPSPLIEYVHVDDLPGGNYTLNVCNRYTLQVGAGGISMKTFGPIQIGGTVVNISGEQLNLASSNEINIDGGKRLTLTSDILVLKQRQSGQVLVDSCLGVNGNLIVGGGAHIEGELSLQHVTAPVEIQETEDTLAYGQTNDQNWATGSYPVIGYVSGIPNDYVTDGGYNWTRVYARTINKAGTPSPNCLYTYAHSHHFRNLPLTLKENNEAVRKAALNNNNADRTAASPQNDSKKGP